MRMANSSASAAVACRACKSLMKAGTLGIVHGRMMAAREPLALRQELIQVAAPPRRVLAAAQPLRLGGVKHALDPTAKAGGGFGLVVPKRLQDRKHVIGGDLVHRQAPERSGIVAQASFPIAQRACRCARTAAWPRSRGRRIRRTWRLLTAFWRPSD